MSDMGDGRAGAAAAPGRSGVGPVAAFVFGVLSSVIAWGAVLVAPWAARRAVARFDYDNAYTVGIAAGSLAVALGLVAAVLGLIHLRKPGEGRLSAAGAAIGASSVFGVAVYAIGTWMVMPRLG